ncbi:MAG: hypothetical protein IM552_06190 [Chitinophagaceae bacterium]|nr:hypothetical protein [Chitinophagaceae bacterium]
MDLPEFKVQIRKCDPRKLAREMIERAEVHALDGQSAYDAFRASIARELPEAEYIALAGSGNWGFSLNPRKLWTPFNEHSDIDVVVISNNLFSSTWDVVRALERSNWHLFTDNQRRTLGDVIDDIYAGFVSPPMTLPLDSNKKFHQFRYRFNSMLNRLSGAHIGYRKVTMRYFRNMVEAADYYSRSIRSARKELV